MISARDVVAGDFLAISYREMWNSDPACLPALPARPRYGSEKAIELPTQMTHELALFLGAYLSEGHTNRSTWSVVITNSVLDVLEEVRAAAEAVFGLRGRICQPQTRCSYLVISSKRLVEFMDLLGCGCRASEKRVPAVMMQSSREHVLTFMRGVAFGRLFNVRVRREVGHLPRQCGGNQRYPGPDDHAGCRQCPDPKVEPEDG